MTIRKYSSRAQQTTLTSSLSSVATTMVVGSGSNLMGGKTPTATETYTVVIDPDTALEEIVDVSNYTSGNTLTIARNIDGSSAVAHSAGAVIRHMVIGRDLQESNDHNQAPLGTHGATTSANLASIISDETGTGSLVFATSPTLVTPALGVATATSINGTTIPSSATLIKTSDTGTVTSTMILDGTILNADVNASAAIAYSKLNLAGAITSSDITNNTILDADINASAAIALSKLATDPLARANHTGTQLAATVSDFDTQVRTNRLDQMAAPTTAVAFNAQKITGLADPTLAQDASTKAYTDAQITNLIAAAPGALDTLNELATALGNDAAFSTTVTNSLAGKLSLTGGTMSGAIAMGTSKITGLGTPTVSTDATTKAYVDATLVSAPGNLTGPITSVGAATSIASQTGTGTKFVVDTSPTLITPVLGVATATSINATPIPASKTLVATDSTAFVVPSQVGHSGKFLTTDGTTSSFASVVTDPTPTALMLGGM